MTDNTKVITIQVNPIDLSAKGGFRQHQQVRGFILRATEAQNSGDAVQSLTADAEIEAWVLKRLSTSDGSPLEDALDEISYEEYLELFKAALGGTSIDPLTSGSSSLQAEAETLSLVGS